MSSVTVGKCTKGPTCYRVVNLTSDTVTFYNTQNGTTYSKATIKGNSSDNVQLSRDLNTAGALSIVSASDASKVYVASFPQEGQKVVTVGGAQGIRPSLTKYFNFYFWPVIGLLLLAAILCFVFMSKVKQQTYARFCEKQQLEGEECAEMLATDSPSVPNKSFVAGAAISLVLMVAMVVFWLFARGPLAYASYSACAKKQNYGTVWRWVQPRSGWRKFLCTVFGACECAADSLQEACKNYSVMQNSGFSWQEEDAAKSTSATSECFCCDSDTGVCRDIVTGEPCEP